MSLPRGVFGEGDLELLEDRAQKEEAAQSLVSRILSMTKTRVSLDTVPRLFDRCYFNTSTRIFWAVFASSFGGTCFVSTLLEGNL